MGFQYRNEADLFLQQLRERMAKFGLELHQEKTRLIEFGRFAAANRSKRGEGKPETFDFLGFTHICAKTKRGNRFTIRRKTIAKRLRAKVKKMKEGIRLSLYNDNLIQSVIDCTHKYTIERRRK